MAYGKVLHSASVHDMALKFPQKQNASTESVETSLTKEPQSSITGVSGAENAGAVVFLFPPKEQLCWSISRLWLVWKLCLLNILKPRVDQLLAANKNGLRSVQALFSKQKIWYLEVIAVHPSLQSRGIGRGVMKWILRHVGDQPIYLECTCRENIDFYESFGFKVVEVVELMDKEQSLKYWTMVRSEKISPGKDL
ncbi:Acyl-CoA N-acyltransferase [Penicillium odoratum]|uniref:Acyl-CoA N-acyltransferase n=1 Tax=Penicillium odoratum TaxID=1167516 RepID=UPI00254819B6|nr:Acyl-CoA N-acyltransferase [Penicillium odoratum]KAJ5778143.1 Acyl-CoA N-acyltransferase [Penicillium odoratum]